MVKDLMLSLASLVVLGVVIWCLCQCEKDRSRRRGHSDNVGDWGAPDDAGG